MDQDTRNKLQRATQRIRRLLEDDFSDQLEGTFDVLPNGKILTEPGQHLNARQRLTRQKLIDAIKHIQADGKSVKEAVDEYTREAAFTFLNRFVALRMLEARGVLQECVSKGDSSSGFKEFCGLTLGLDNLDDGGYRLYLECLFDELTVEVKILFDRRDSASLLWPRRTALSEVLALVGQSELAGVWCEDETIGWVYQYFNSDEERKEMRDASPKAPRSSRELAVRNQFFTPRYVVAFLTDNTLGRIWYEMKKGQTRLTDDCQYLVRRPAEVFLNESQESPAEDSVAEEELSQDEVLGEIVYILHRAKKDPRDLKILDPACGSGHFLLYAFDLLIAIYEEAWHDEESPKSEATGRRLREDFSDLEKLRASLPCLVLTNNLHGVDIDPRAAQIAVLALWMRAQRAFSEFTIAREKRLPITRSNIVCAEPMPGEGQFLDEFIAEHLSDDAEGHLLASLVRNVFKAMTLAGEAGSLLMIENDIAEEVAKAKKQWLDGPKYRQQTLFGNEPTRVQTELDLTRGITDESFWEKAELRIYEALHSYAERTERSGGFQRRLFSVDATRGFAFIDISRQLYDVILMNPPFGYLSASSSDYISKAYPDCKHDIALCMIERGMQSLRVDGRLGAIITRTPLFLPTSESWRLRYLLGEQSKLDVCADFGLGVLDATVESAALTIHRTPNRRASDSASFIRAIESGNKAATLALATHNFRFGRCGEYGFHASLKDFSCLPLSPISYWIDPSILRTFRNNARFLEDNRDTRCGLGTLDDFRFIRLTWEVAQEHVGRDLMWSNYADGGSFTPFFESSRSIVKWLRNGIEVKQYVTQKVGSASRKVQGSKYYFREGLTFPRRTKRFCPKLLSKQMIFSTAGQGIFLNGREEIFSALGLLSSDICKYLLGLSHGANSQDQGGTNPQFQVGLVNRLPWPSEFVSKQLVESTVAAVRKTMEHESLYETSRYFNRPTVDRISTCTVSEHYFAFSNFKVTATNYLAQRVVEINDRARDLFGLSVDEYKRVQNALGAENDFVLSCEKKQIFAERIVSWLVGASFGRCSNIDIVEENDPLAEYPPSSPAFSFGSSEPCGVKMFVDDPGHQDDLMQRITAMCDEIWAGRGSEQLSELAGMLKSDNLGQWIARKFFDAHSRLYSANRRKAPVYWQLATASASYSVWIYYHRVSHDTFFQVLNDYVRPKQDHERQKLERLRSEAGVEPSQLQRKEIEEHEKFVAELSAMVEEVERIAPLWNPNLNDGVIINFAPLWRLVPQSKTWQKDCQMCWDKLVKGTYDWAHLAMHLWPERVVPKCVEDASLAIAHGLEEVFWEQDERERFHPKEEPDGGWEPVVERLVKERSSPAVKAALQSLLDTPVPSSSAGKSRRRSRTS